MSDEAAFLAVLKANPADDLTRLVYADWLDEHNEPAKGQYLRAMVDLARLSGGTAEYNDAAGRLYTACLLTPSDWRRAAGARFDVVLNGYEDKIRAIKIVRERTGLGLAHAKALAESVPTPLLSWLPFEEALPHLLAFHAHDSHGRVIAIRAAIRPTAWPEGSAPGAVFDVYLHSANFGSYSSYAISDIARLLRVSEREVRKRLKSLPIVVGSGLQPAEVADFVRQLKLACNVGGTLPADAIRVVPRLPPA